MKLGILISALSVSLINSSPIVAGGCTEYLLEAEARTGVVPRFNNSGNIDAIFLHGEGIFTTHTPSQISVARQNAELSAKQGFSSWLETNLSYETRSESSINQSTETNNAGVSTSTSSEVQNFFQFAKENTSAILRGLIKLDECMDTNLGIVLVTFGWKPDSSDEQTKSTADMLSDSDAVKIEKNRIITHEVYALGEGKSFQEALNNALRLSVSQIHGEIFSSEIFNTNISFSKEESNDYHGVTQNYSNENLTLTQTENTTSGIIDSYQILDSSIINGIHKVEVRAYIPRLKINIKDDDINIVIIPPVRSDQSISSRMFADVSRIVHREVQSVLSKAAGVNILERKDLSELDGELNLIKRDEFKTSEYAKLGNRLGADFIVIKEFSDFVIKKRVFFLAGERLEITDVSAIGWVRVVDVATSSILFTQIVPTEISVRVPSKVVPDLSLRMAHSIALAVSASLSGGLDNATLGEISEVRQTIEDFTLASERINNARDQIRQKSENEW